MKRVLLDHCAPRRIALDRRLTELARETNAPKAKIVRQALERVAPKGRARRKAPTMPQIMAWYDSIRRTTDWEPARMPPGEVRRVSLG